MIQQSGYCACWEKPLKKFKSRKGPSILRIGKVIENSPAQEEKSSYEDLVLEFERVLTMCGLLEHEINLIILRYAEGFSWKDIKKREGWVDSKSLDYHYKNALKKLKKAGYKE